MQSLCNPSPPWLDDPSTSGLSLLWITQICLPVRAWNNKAIFTIQWLQYLLQQWLTFTLSHPAAIWKAIICHLCLNATGAVAYDTRGDTCSLLTLLRGCSPLRCFPSKPSGLLHSTSALLRVHDWLWVQCRLWTAEWAVWVARDQLQARSANVWVGKTQIYNTFCKGRHWET